MALSLYIEMIFEAKCGKCKKTTELYNSNNEIGMGVLSLDFDERAIVFFCPECNYTNRIDMKILESKIKNTKSLPKITGVTY